MSEGPFFIYCLRESVNPYLLCVVFLFGLFLLFSRIATGYKIFFGLIFISSFFLSKSSIDLSIALFSNSNKFLIFPSGTMGIILVIFFSVLAVINLYDWWQAFIMEKPQKVILHIPPVGITVKRKRPFLSTGIGILALGGGILGALVATGYTGNSYLLGTAEYFLKSNHTGAGVQLILEYNACLLFPLVLIFIVTIAVARSKGFYVFFEKKITLSRIIFAGLFLGISVAFAYILYRLYL